MPIMANHRKENLISKNKMKGYKREVFWMYSKGSFLQTDPEVCTKVSYESKFVLTEKKEFTQVAVGHFDVSSLNCCLGQFGRRYLLRKLRTLISQIRPVEVIIESNSIPNKRVKMLKNQATSPLFSNLVTEKCLSLIAIGEIRFEHD